jgi:hypothetical protein
MPTYGGTLPTYARRRTSEHKGVYIVGKIKNPDLGPGWSDVATALADAHRTWGGSFVFSLRWGYTASRENGLYVVLTRSERGSRGTPGAEHTIGANWPNADSRTMPALMWRMLLEMGEKFEAARLLAERQADF